MAALTDKKSDAPRRNSSAPSVPTILYGAREEKRRRGFQSLYEQVRHVLEESRATAYRAVNYAMVRAYWSVGRLIVEEEQRGKSRAGYGERLIETLADRLAAEFGPGFDGRNLRSMRAFYLAFPIRYAARTKSSQVPDHLPKGLNWTHFRILLKVEKPEARAFYARECAENGWSTRQLERQIDTFFYERLLSSRNKTMVRKTSLDGESLHPRDLIKDPYVLEFLNVKGRPALLEKDLESLLIGQLQDFLLELGKGFSFVGRQKRISAGTDHFYVDLVFYNYELKCFVLIDLKMGKLTHQDIGQMDFYVRYFEETVKASSDGPTIGLILCSEKNETIVKYSVLRESRRLFASKYKLHLPTENELREELNRERRLLEMEKRLKDPPTSD
jgi:predicted nuclease of restriction endonuclease-like (RecB) superfamily